ncbi:MAG: hypothetical protein ACRD4S_14750 [Candidatus Acidiferrales bacterium]
MAPRRKRPKTELEKMSDKKLLKEIRKDLHTMILEAEGAIALKSKKRKE